MNREECVKCKCVYNEYWELIQRKLKMWKTSNGLKGRYVVHHRDDTDECRKYNNEHYELWGFNEDGSFEYGKYVVFMSNKDHMSHHAKQRTGERNPFYGRKHSDEFRQSVSLRQKDKPRSEAYRKYARDISNKYTAYKQNGGYLKWNDFLIAVSKHEISLETLIVSTK